MRVPHIHEDCLNSFALSDGQLIEKRLQGFGFALFADKNNTATEIVQYNGQVALTFSEGDFVHSQNPGDVFQ